MRSLSSGTVVTFMFVSEALTSLSLLYDLGKKFSSMYGYWQIIVRFIVVHNALH